VKKVKEDTNIEVKVEETSDECKIVIIDKRYSERYKKILCYRWLATDIPKQPKTNRRLFNQVSPSLIELWLHIHINNLHNINK